MKTVKVRKKVKNIFETVIYVRYPPLNSDVGILTIPQGFCEQFPPLIYANLKSVKSCYKTIPLQCVVSL